MKYFNSIESVLKTYKAMGVLIEKTTVVHRLEKNGTASPGLVYEAFVPVIPPKKTLWQLMYSRKSGKILGRTPRNWGDNSFSVNNFHSDV